MALREFLYPSLDVRLVLARRLDVDSAAAGQGTLSTTYQEVAARITLSTRDAQRLGLKMDNTVEVTSKEGHVVVHARLDDSTPEGLAVMAPSPYASALLPIDLPHQGITITLKATKSPITPITSLP